MSIFRFAPLALLLAAAPAGAGPGKGLTIDDMLAMRRVGEPAVSPDGKWVAFSLRDTDLTANKGRTDVWLAAVDGSTVVASYPCSENSLSAASCSSARVRAVLLGLVTVMP